MSHPGDTVLNSLLESLGYEKTLIPMETVLSMIANLQSGLDFVQKDLPTQPKKNVTEQKVDTKLPSASELKLISEQNKYKELYTKEYEENFKLLLQAMTERANKGYSDVVYDLKRDREIPSDLYLNMLRDISKILKENKYKVDIAGYSLIVNWND